MKSAAAEAPGVPRGEAASGAPAPGGERGARRCEEGCPGAVYAVLLIFSSSSPFTAIAIFIANFTAHPLLSFPTRPCVSEGGLFPSLPPPPTLPPSPYGPWLLQCGGCGYARSTARLRTAAVPAPPPPSPPTPGRQPRPPPGGWLRPVGPLLAGASRVELGVGPPGARRGSGGARTGLPGGRKGKQPKVRPSGCLASLM